MASVSETAVRHSASISTCGCAKASDMRGPRPTIVGCGGAPGPVRARLRSGDTVAGLPLDMLVSRRSD